MLLVGADGGAINADVAGNISLSNSGNNAYVVHTANASDSTIMVDLDAAGDISLSSDLGGGISSSGTVSLDAGDSISIDTMNNGVYNRGGTIALSANNLLSISSESNDGINAFSGTTNINGKNVQISGKKTGILIGKSSEVNLGQDEEGKRIESLRVKADGVGINSDGATGSTFNLYADDTTIHSVGNYAIQASTDEFNIVSSKFSVTSEQSSGIVVKSGTNFSLKSDEIKLNSGDISLRARSGGQIKIEGDQNAAVKSFVVETGSGTGIQADVEGSLIEIAAINTEIISNEQMDTAPDAQPYHGNTIFATNYGKIVFLDIGNAQQQITANSKWGAMFASNNGSIEVQSGSVDLTGSVLVTNASTIRLGTQNALTKAVFTLEGENSGADNAAIIARNGTVEVNAVQASISSPHYAVLATGQDSDYVDSLVNIEASELLEITGDIASTIHRKDPSVVTEESTRIVNINQEASGTIVINGNVSTVGNDLTRSEVNIGLKTADSVLNGSINDTYLGTDTTKDTGGTNLSLENGATWNVTGDSAFNSLTGDEGVVTTNGHQVTVDTITNELGGTTIETTSGEANQIKVARVVGDGLEIHLTDDAAKDLDASDLPGSLASVADIGQTDSDVTITSDEYGVYGDMKVVLGENGEAVSFTEAKNTVTQGLQDIAANNFLFFRSQMNDVSKRMGDLRSMPSAAGAWARYYGGEMKYGDMDMESRYNTLQIGADQRFGNFYLGLSASYSDGNGTLANGSTDDKNYNFGVYGGWVADNGQYVDVIVKRHRLETDATLYYTSGLSNNADYNNWATSLSVEYGWRFNCPSTGFYVEPQAELLYGRMDSVDFTTSRGVNVSQDAIDTLVGRLGAAIGYTFDDNRGSAYFTASVLHDWKAETDTTVRYNGISRHYQDDLGGTWGEFSLGGTYNVTDSFSAYGDVMTTTGSPVRNPWQISVGVRYTF